MKKKLLATALWLTMLFTLTGCMEYSSTGDFSNEYVDLELVEYMHDGAIIGRILVDKDTGVLYLWYKDNNNYGQTLTPLYYADGSLKNISDFDE